MKKYSVEFAHIYTNEDVHKEREIELLVLNNLFKKIDRNDVGILVMVDDYSFPDPTFNYNNFKNNLEKIGYKIDYSIRESQLIESCDIFLENLKDKNLKEELVEYVKLKKKYPCSLFVASWYMIRFGKINSKLFDQSFVSEKIINILPKSFKPYEDKAFELIKNSEYADKLSDIENIYFEGREI